MRRQAPDFGVPTRKQKEVLPEGRAERRRFYNSAQWRKCRALKLAESPLCELCLEQDAITPATEVHHVEKLADAPERALDLSNLMGLCLHHHNSLTAQGF
jgi:5-methylcytosine-specific restriction endonuclease McrA